ncbi:MAG: hypothetical protein LW629_07955 [Burkholderiales bacterium]|jgi:hypothetical protein|nr:hypothetical protein [Burkholderiales bacterium]
MANSQQANLIVQRGEESFTLQAGQSLKPGDIIRNAGTDSASVGSVSLVKEYPSLIAKVPPGATVRVTDVGNPEDEVLGLEAVDGPVEISEANAELASNADFAINPEVETVSGLFGAVPLIGGGLLGPAGAAIALAALASGSNGDGNGGDSPTSGGQASGLAGGVQNLGDGINQTPLAPVTAVTDPVAGGLAMVGDALVNSGDPSGVAAALGTIVGTPDGGTGSAQDGGLVGLLATASEGINDAVATGPLEPLSGVTTPATQTLGSDSGSTDGVAQGLANAGSTLTDDQSALSPLTSEVLGPVVGNSGGQDGGLPQTLTQTSEGLTDLTAQDATLAPLDPLTSGIAGGVDTLAGGIAQAGQALADQSAQDPSGITTLVADLLGGETQPISSASGGGDPLAPLTALAG